jgi:hypothetical protein
LDFPDKVFEIRNVEESVAPHGARLKDVEQCEQVARNVFWVVQPSHMPQYLVQLPAEFSL